MQKKSRKLNRILALLLSLAMAMSMVPEIAMAETAADPVTGKDTEDGMVVSVESQEFGNEPEAYATTAEGTDGGLYWVLDDSGTLTISGSGPMTSYTSNYNYPWYNYASQIISLDVQSGVTSIGSYAFAYYSSLESIKLADTVTSLEGRCFMNCYSLTNVDLGKGVTSMGAYCFGSCTAAVSFEIPASVRSIGSYCFWNCTSLTSMEFPYGVETIDDHCFMNCTSLKSVVIPDSVTSMGGYFFSGCSVLSNVTISRAVTTLPTYCFYNCSSLVSYDVPDTITDIESFCFCGCTALESISLGSGITELPARCFSGCTSLAGIDIPDTVSAIGEWCFYNCSSLASITIPNSATSLEPCIFYSCESLTDVVISDSVTSIGSDCFYNCENLKSVMLGSGITSIGARAFALDAEHDQQQESAKIVFTGNAPTTFASDSFDKMTFAAYYPCGNTTWTDPVRTDYGGTITWVVDHTFNNGLTWNWSEDYSSATATGTCSACGAVETVDADVTVGEKDPTCTEPGGIEYTAVATFNGVKEYTDTKLIEEEPALGHKWGTAVFEWSNDNESATAARTCTACGATEAVVAKVSVEVVTEPECEKTGRAVYTAVAVFDDDAEYTDSKTADIPALGHSWRNPVFEWNDDYSRCTATRICERCRDTETVNAEVSYEVTIEPTETESGEGAYTATATFDDGTVVTSDPVTVKIPPTDVDKSGLDEEIADAEKLNQNDYTEESWAELQKALENAEAVSNDPYASQEDVNAAAEAVKEAISNLVKASVTPTPEAKNGFVQENGEWHYYDNGTRFTGTDIKEDTNKVVDGTDGWFYIENGRINFNKTGIEQNNNGWWRVVKGKVDFNCNSVEQNDYGWWYVVGGKVQFGYTGVSNYSNAYGWWYIKDGKVDFGKTGIEENNYGWWRVVSGKVDFSCNSVEQNSYGWWYVVGGKVQFGYTGVSNYSNAYGWWYIKDGKVDFGKTSIEQNNYGWWRVAKGKVDFSCNSVEQNQYGWWYVVGGKVQFGYTGVANYANANGWWYIKNGKVDFSYVGRSSNNYGTWNVVNGKVVF